MLPGLIKYFSLRGYNAEEAKRIAALTIKKWFNEGMSTQASKKYSKTGSRHHFIEAAFVGNDSNIDSYMLSNFDHAVEEEYLKTKSEIV